MTNSNPKNDILRKPPCTSELDPNPTSVLNIDTDGHYSNRLSIPTKITLKQEFMAFDEDYPVGCENLDSWMFVNPIKYPNSGDRVKIRKHKFTVYKVCRVFETILAENQDYIDEFMKIQQRAWKCVERTHLENGGRQGFYPSFDKLKEHFLNY